MAFRFNERCVYVKGADGVETQDSDKPILAVSPDGQITPIQFTFGPLTGKPWWSVSIKANGQYNIEDLRNALPNHGGAYGS